MRQALCGHYEALVPVRFVCIDWILVHTTALRSLCTLQHANELGISYFEENVTFI